MFRDFSVSRSTVILFLYASFFVIAIFLIPPPTLQKEGRHELTEYDFDERFEGQYSAEPHLFITAHDPSHLFAKAANNNELVTFFRANGDMRLHFTFSYKDPKKSCKIKDPRAYQSTIVLGLPDKSLRFTSIAGRERNFSRKLYKGDEISIIIEKPYPMCGGVSIYLEKEALTHDYNQIAIYALWLIFVLVALGATHYYLNNLIVRTVYPAFDRAFVYDNRRNILLAIAIFLSALFLRSWENALNPGLYMEDATHYFNVYYGADKEFQFILQKPNGYYNILNNFVAWVVAKYDVRIQPLLYHIFGFTSGIATAVCFLFSGLVRNRFILLATPVVLGLSGMNHIYYYNTLTFQMYNVVVLLLCFLFYPVPRSPIYLLLLCIMATLLIWSGPYSVIALPVSLIFLALFKNRSKTILFILVIFNVLLYSISAEESTIRLYNIVDPGLRHIAIETLFERVFFMDLLGNMTATKISILFLVLITVAYTLRNNSFYLKTSIVFFTLILVALAPLFLSIKFPLYRAVFPAHIYVSQFFWLCFILFSADRLLEKTQPTKAIQLTILFGFFIFVTYDNIRHPAKGKKQIMVSIPNFVRAVHLTEQLELEKKNQYIVVKTVNIIPKNMPPIIRVGSKRPDALRIGSNDVPINIGKEFIVDERKTEEDL